MIKTYEEELETKEGFKKTKIGWIPSNWSLKILDELGKIFTGGTPSTTNNLYWNGSTNWFTPSEISKSGKHVYESLRKISKDGVKKSSATLMPKGTIIVCTRATIGDLAITTEESTTNQGFKSIYPHDSVDTEFLYYLIDSQKANLIRKSSGSTFLELSTTNFRRFKVAVPSLPEQQKIASILSDWDRAIENTQFLINKLQLRKKGLTQQLLTGKTRLAGFNDEWKEVKLGDITDRITKKNEELDDTVVTISAQRGFIKQEDFFNKRVASSTLSGYYLIEKGDFAYNKSYSNGYPMGAFKRLDDFDKAVVTTLYICFSVKDNIDSDFLMNYFEGGLMVKNLMKIAQEGGRAHGLLNIGLNDFFNLKLTIPSKEEQAEIAKVVNTVDDEIKNYQDYLEQLQAQKKGLMQQLLTGKIRVKL